ncbi:hypothetical protein [Methylomonas koyamae]|uniref:hypothetical protein n=1 Tax=Methylomonas koyamae TaxID=702114 RepID=UPI0006D111F7|nr:hypothetical protein [Methylomonas koyamae]BBL59899.1 hypothetical protein MKFW12EY_35120 [Methylomonas koyamae]
MPYKFDDSLLTNEKSLWDIYKSARKIQPNKFQLLLVLLVMLFLGINAFIFESNVPIMLSDVRVWAANGFNFSITTLGFLIAGFTIFATLSKPEMMLAMMEHTNKETGLPTLKYNFFTFMNVFIAYIALALFYLLIILLGQPHGFMSNFLALLPDESYFKATLIKISYVLVGTSFVYLLLLLKSFIFNIYAIVMNFLRWEYHANN